MCTCVDRRYVIARSGKLGVPFILPQHQHRLSEIGPCDRGDGLARISLPQKKKTKSECTLTERVPRAAAGKNPNRRGRTPSSTPCLRSEEDLGVADGGVELRHRMQPAACVCLCCGLWQLRSALLPSARAQVAAVSTAYRDTHKWIQLLQQSVDFRMIFT